MRRLLEPLANGEQRRGALADGGGELLRGPRADIAGGEDVCHRCLEVLRLHESPAVELQRPLQEVGVGVEPDEDEDAVRLSAPLLAAVAVHGDHLLEAATAAEVKHVVTEHGGTITVKLRDPMPALLPLAKHTRVLVDRTQHAGPGGGPIPVLAAVANLSDADLARPPRGPAAGGAGPGGVHVRLGAPHAAEPDRALRGSEVAVDGVGEGADGLHDPQ